MKKILTNPEQEAQQFPYQLREEYFLPCPFCGNIPNVFQVPENRYGEYRQFGWIVQCANMGCIIYQDFEENTGDQSLSNLISRWNSRTPKFSQPVQ